MSDIRPTQPRLDIGSLQDSLGDIDIPTLRQGKLTLSEKPADGRVKSAVKHVKRNKKAYKVGAVLVVGGVVGYKLGARVTYGKAAKVVDEMTEVVKKVQMDSINIDDVYRNGMIPVVMTDKQHQLYMGVLVNAGEITNEMARDTYEMVEDIRGFLGVDRPAA